MATDATLEDILELKDLLEPTWGERLEAIKASGVPVNVDDDDDDDGTDDGTDRDDDDERVDDDDGTDDGTDRDDDDEVDDDDGDSDRRVDWKKHSRRHERREKQLRKQLDEVNAELSKIRRGQQTAQQRAVDAARREGEELAERKYQAQLRANALESTVTIAAAKGFDIEVTKDGKKVTERVSFADADDALLHLQRLIKKGEVDEDELFAKDGTIDKKAVTEALAEILEEKKHLRAPIEGASGETGKKRKGSSDAGKGRGGAKPLDEMSPAEHLKAIQKR